MIKEEIHACVKHMNTFFTLSEVFAISFKKKIPKSNRSIGIHCL